MTGLRDLDRYVQVMSDDELHEQDRLCAALLAYQPRRTFAAVLLAYAREIQADLYFRESGRREPGDLTDDELTECIELAHALTLVRPRRMVAVPLLDYLHALSHERDEREAGHSSAAAHACACGETFTSTGELDDHLTCELRPKDDTGADGRQHYEIADSRG